MAPALADPASVGAWLADRLEEEGIPHALGGAVALAAHGIPRNTADVDMSVFVPEGELDRLFDALERAGCLFDRAHALAEVRRISLFTVRCAARGAAMDAAYVRRWMVAIAGAGDPRCATLDDLVRRFCQPG